MGVAIARKIEGCKYSERGSTTWNGRRDRFKSDDGIGWFGGICAPVQWGGAMEFIDSGIHPAVGASTNSIGPDQVLILGVDLIVAVLIGDADGVLGDVGDVDIATCID